MEYIGRHRKPDSEQPTELIETVKVGKNWDTQELRVFPEIREVSTGRRNRQGISWEDVLAEIFVWVLVAVCLGGVVGILVWYTGKVL